MLVILRLNCDGGYGFHWLEMAQFSPNGNAAQIKMHVIQHHVLYMQVLERVKDKRCQTVSMELILQCRDSQS